VSARSGTGKANSNAYLLDLQILFTYVVEIYLSSDMGNSRQCSRGDSAPRWRVPGVKASSDLVRPICYG